MGTMLGHDVPTNVLTTRDWSAGKHDNVSSMEIQHNGQEMYHNVSQGFESNGLFGFYPNIKSYGCLSR